MQTAHEFIDKARENIDTAIFTINMAEMPLSEVADFLQMFVSEIEVPESGKNKTISLSADMQKMKEIIHDLGLKMDRINKNFKSRNINDN
jgi:hypothetical protein